MIRFHPERDANTVTCPLNLCGLHHHQVDQTWPPCEYDVGSMQSWWTKTSRVFPSVSKACHWSGSLIVISSVMRPLYSVMDNDTPFSAAEVSNAIKLLSSKIGASITSQTVHWTKQALQ